MIFLIVLISGVTIMGSAIVIVTMGATILGFCILFLTVGPIVALACFLMGQFRWTTFKGEDGSFSIEVELGYKQPPASKCVSNKTPSLPSAEEND